MRARCINSSSLRERPVVRLDISTLGVIYNEAYYQFPDFMTLHSCHCDIIYYLSRVCNLSRELYSMLLLRIDYLLQTDAGRFQYDRVSYENFS